MEDATAARRQCPPAMPLPSALSPLGLLGVVHLPVAQRTFKYLRWQDQIIMREVASAFEVALGALVTSLRLDLPLTKSQRDTGRMHEISRPLRVFNCLKSLSILVMNDSDAMSTTETAALLDALMNPSLTNLEIYDAQLTWVSCAALANLPRCTALEALSLGLHGRQCARREGEAMHLTVTSGRFPNLKELHLGGRALQTHPGGPVMGLLTYYMHQPAHFASLEACTLELCPRRPEEVESLTELGARLGQVGPKRLQSFTLCGMFEFYSPDVDYCADIVPFIAGACSNAPRLEELYLRSHLLTSGALTDILGAAAPLPWGAPQLRKLSGVCAMDWGPLASAIRGGRLGGLHTLGLFSLFEKIPGRPRPGGAEPSCSTDPMSEVLECLAQAGVCPELQTIQLQVSRFDRLLLRTLWSVVTLPSRRLRQVELRAIQQLPAEALADFENGPHLQSRTCRMSATLIQKLLQASAGLTPDNRDHVTVKAAGQSLTTTKIPSQNGVGPEVELCQPCSTLQQLSFNLSDPAFWRHSQY